MTAKKVALNIIKVIAGISAVVFWLIPLRTGTQLLLFVASMVVMLICFAISANLDDSNTGYWPSNPEDSPLVSKIPPGAAGRTTSPEQPNITEPNPHE